MRVELNCHHFAASYYHRTHGHINTSLKMLFIFLVLYAVSFWSYLLQEKLRIEPYLCWISSAYCAILWYGNSPFHTIKSKSNREPKHAVWYACSQLKVVIIKIVIQQVSWYPFCIAEIFLLGKGQIHTLSKTAWM